MNKVQDKTKLIPELRFPGFSDEWTTKKLGDIAKFSKGASVSKDDIDEDGSTEAIRYGELYTTYNELIEFIKSKTNLAKQELVFSKKNDVIIPASGESKVDIATASAVLKDGVALGGDINIIRSDNDGVFLAYYLNNTKKNQIAMLAQGVSIVHLYPSNLKSLSLNLPQLSEQHKIANFLTVVERKITLLEQKVESIQHYKKGVIQEIFSQEIRFKDEGGKDYPDWQEISLGEFLIKHDEKASINNQYPVLTSSRRGIFFQKDYYSGNDVASKDTTGYNVVPRGYFTYRHMSDDLVFKFNINTIVDKGIVSTLYPVFKTKNIDDRFLLLKLNEGSEFKRLAMEQKQGGSRTYMYFAKLKNLKLSLPILSEQQKISNFMGAIDEKIVVEKNKLGQAKQFKKALLQRMFI